MLYKNQREYIYFMESMAYFHAANNILPKYDYDPVYMDRYNRLKPQKHPLDEIKPIKLIDKKDLFINDVVNNIPVNTKPLPNFNSDKNDKNSFANNHMYNLLYPNKAK